ncbi:MAG: hypothetical protein KAX38_07495 [Candidatus Krumholzibacteria bacterium]|nr:hypothetical protein [Candidatus Krumholzibacteria bacterium]
MSNIAKHTARIRNVINILKVTDELVKNRKQWLILTSALDVLEDTNLAIDSYSKHFGTKMEFASGYLEIYGVLQAMFIQQTAVKNIFETFKIPFDKSEVLNSIRLIRNKAIGHPMNQGKGSSHYITRVSMCWEGFTLLKAGHNISDDNSALQVDLKTFIVQQNEILERRLDNCARIVENRYAHYINE